MSLFLWFNKADTTSFKALPFGAALSMSTLIIFRDGHGTAQANSVSQSLSHLAGVILIVNCPQIIFSTLYFLYNRCYTCMLAMHEWTSFATTRQSLRVSCPIGIQRSTYWLQLPYRYSMPLLLASGLMHWLISESIFLVRLEFLDHLGNATAVSPELNPTSNVMTVPGYSSKAISAAMGVAWAMIAVLIAIGHRRYQSAMPLPGNNSWAISAACHCPDDDDNAAINQVMWGAVVQPCDNRPGHCCFTSQPVETPIIGERYT